jgi:nucleoside-diphosphate-sugar epimerase
VRAVDYAPLDRWYQVSPEAENLVVDLKLADACDQAAAGATTIYNLAADMGGMGFIEANKARCMLSVLINAHMLDSARRHDVERYFFSSSACVYAADKQLTPDIEPLKESDAYPADPEDGYGWEKLFSERMCRHFTEDFGLTTRVARYHNVYGPHGTWTGGREKAPAAICRKIAEATVSGDHEIEIWARSRSWRATSRNPSISAAARWSRSTGSWTSSKRSPGSRSSVATTSMLRRAYAGATATTP